MWFSSSSLTLKRFVKQELLRGEKVIWGDVVYWENKKDAVYTKIHNEGK